MKKKALIIGGGAVALVAVIVALILIFTGGENAYRSIKVFEIDGSCKVERDGDTLDAFKNMALSSGDTFTVGDGSFARLKLDDDKYVYLEANTKINLTATGTANDSKTMVYIERGSMLTEVKKKLSATSSYDIVTPNTTMSIRGTKTLTEVIEDLVTGHVQTSNAVLEGQVKIKAVKVKADGTVVSVERDLGAGEGNAFKSAKEELVSQEEMQAIAETGASVSGIKVEIVSEEEAGVVFDVATFDATFLESVKNILITDAEAATGEELSQEEIDAINAQMEEAIKSLDVIAEDSQNAINKAAETEQSDSSYVTDSENVSYETPATQSESLGGPESTPLIENDDASLNETDGASVNVIEEDGDTSLVGLEVGDGTDEDNDEIVDEESDDTKGSGEDKEDEPDIEDENDKADTDESDQQDENDKNKVSDEEKETDDQLTENARPEENSEVPTDTSGNQSGDSNNDQPAESADSGDPNTSDDRTVNQGSSGSSSSTSVSSETDNDSVTVTYNGGRTSYSFGSSQGQTSVPYELNLTIFDQTSEKTYSFSNANNSLRVGDDLPGYGASIYEVHVTEGSDSDISERFEFAGWYKTQNGAQTLNPNEEVRTVSSEASNLYPGIRPREVELRFYNLYPEAGHVVIPDNPADGLTYVSESNYIKVTGLRYGDVYKLPEVERLASLRASINGTPDSYKDLPYIEVPDGTQDSLELDLYTQTNDFFFYSRSSSINASKVYLYGQYDSNNIINIIKNPVFFTHKEYLSASSSSTIEQIGDPSVITVGSASENNYYMYFATAITLEVNDMKLRLPDETGYKSVSYYADDSPSILETYIGDGSDQSREYWELKRGGVQGYEYMFRTIYYGKSLHSLDFAAPDELNENWACLTMSSSGSFTVNDITKSLSEQELYDTTTLLVSGSGTQHPFPIYNTSNTTELSRTPYRIEVNSREYAILDMSGADYYFYESFNNLQNLGNGRFKTALISCKSDGSGFTSYSGSNPYSAVNSATCTDGQTYNREQFLDINKGKTLVALPDDLINPWYLHGGTRAGDYTTFTGNFITAFSQYYPYVAKQNYRLVGYDLSYTIEGGETRTEQMLLNSGEGTQFYVFKIGDYGGDPSVIAGTNVHELSLHNTPASPVTIKPRFAPVTPFTVTTESIGANMNGDNSKLIFSNIDLNYVSEISVGADYTSNTNLTPNETDAGNAQGMNYLYIIYTDDSQKLMRTPLLGSLRYNKNTGKFDHVIYFADDYSSAPVIKNSYDIVDGTLSVPIFDLTYIPPNTGTTAETLRVITFKSNIEDNTYSESVSALNQFVNKERKMHFTYSTTEAYGDKWVTSKESMITSDISTYDPLASQVYLTYNGYPQYIFEGCEINIELHFQTKRFCLEDVLKDMGVIEPDATGTKIYSITSSAGAGVYSITDSTYSIDLTQSGSIPSDGYLASDIYIIPEVNEQTGKIPTDKECIHVSYTNEDTSVSINVMSLLAP